MKAIVIRETGGPDVLRYEEADRPQPGDGEVLVAVRAASVNPIDWKQRGSLDPEKLPAILGRDVSGVVEESRAEGFSKGDEVFGWAASGGYAEYATASAGEIARKPPEVSFEAAACIPVAGVTAWQALFDKGGLESGQRVLIAGGAGGVGHLAVQFAAKVAGAHTIATGSARNHDFVVGLGAGEYVDYTQQDVASAVSDVDVVFDTVGGETTNTLVPTLRSGGVIVTIAGAPPEDAAAERGARAVLHVTSPDPEQLAQIAGLIAAGTVSVEIAEVLDLADAARAHELSESGHTRGKLVLRVP
ncbi:MAG TPA: NADP-dependent oxidoreductase [Thermoleophilaceae bacterium]|nr:NADP-dependent oxidoreductase [Thermoleophilaceae bacterium]